MTEYLDLEGFKTFAARALIKRSGTKNYWELNNNYVPLNNEIIIYTDAFEGRTPSGIVTNSPGIKIGDGITKVGDLTFIAGEKKLDHGLTIGEHYFDGSADVTIPIYKGNIF